MTEIKVTNCRECPFANLELLEGCNIDSNVYQLQMPADKVHDKCPLKENSITVSLNKES